MYETRDFGVSNQEVREVKDRTSGCERRDFSHSCRVYAGLKGYKEMSLYILLIYLFYDVGLNHNERKTSVSYL